VIAPEGPVVDPDNGKGFGSRPCPASDNAQQRVVADRYHQALGEGSARPTTEGKAKMVDNALHASRAASPFRNDVVAEPLGKDSLAAPTCVTTEASGHQSKPDSATCGRQIGDMAMVAAVNPA